MEIQSWTSQEGRVWGNVHSGPLGMAGCIPAAGTGSKKGTSSAVKYITENIITHIKKAFALRVGV